MGESGRRAILISAAASSSVLAPFLSPSPATPGASAASAAATAAIPAEAPVSAVHQPLTASCAAELADVGERVAELSSASAGTWVEVADDVGMHAMRNPRLNGGLALSPSQRKQRSMLGLFPEVQTTLDEEVTRQLAALHRIAEREQQRSGRADGDTNDADDETDGRSRRATSLAQYEFLMGLQQRQEAVFYALVQRDLEKWLPVLYTPTVGDACLAFGTLSPRPIGLYVPCTSTEEDIERRVATWRAGIGGDVRVCIITDGERVLGLGDLGVHGMGIVAGKAVVYSASAALAPWQVLPVALDVGTNNASLRADPFYLGVRRRRLRGAEYLAFAQAVVGSLQRHFGERVIIHWEDVGVGSSFRLLELLQRSAVTFNDDIQATAAVVLGGLLSSMRKIGQELRDQRFLIFGAGQAGLGIAALLESTIAADHTVSDTLVSTSVSASTFGRRVFVMDSNGLVFDGRSAPITPLKQPFAAAADDLLNLPGVPQRTSNKSIRHAAAGATAASNPAALALPPLSFPENGGGAAAAPPLPFDATSLSACVDAIRPTVLIGVSGVKGAFTKEVLRAMARHTEQPVIFALSNPLSACECTAAEALAATDGRAVFASGTAFPPTTVRRRDGMQATFTTGFANNAFVFPGISLGAILANAGAITPSMFAAAAKAIAAMTSDDNLARGCVYPSPSMLPKAARQVAAFVAEAALKESSHLCPVPTLTRLQAAAEALAYRPQEHLAQI